MTFSENVKKVVEDDLEKMMGKPVINKKLWVWLVVDFFIIQLFIGPCNVLIWRGGWNLYNYIFGETFTTGIGLFIFGVFLSIPIVVYSTNISLLADKILLDKSRGCCGFRYVFVTRLYSAITFFVMLFFWKGWFDMTSGSTFDVAQRNQYLEKLKSQTCDKDHWYFSLGCLVLGSSVLMYLGCFKTAALCPPMGLWLDTATHYIHVDQFFPVEEETNESMNFRILNAILTVVIEVIALITYYGAYCLIEFLLHEKVVELFGSTGLQASGFLLALAVVLSSVSYVSSIFYLYILFETENKYWSSTIKTLLYNMILIVSVTATAMHFRASWFISDRIKQLIFKENPEAVYPEVIFLSLGTLVTVLLGVGSGNHFGISWEKKKEQNGVLLPFIYFTYIFRDGEGPRDDDMVVDHIANFMEDSILDTNYENR